MEAGLGVLQGRGVSLRPPPSVSAPQPLIWVWLSLAWALPYSHPCPELPPRPPQAPQAQCSRQHSHGVILGFTAMVGDQGDALCWTPPPFGPLDEAGETEAQLERREALVAEPSFNPGQPLPTCAGDCGFPRDA